MLFRKKILEIEEWYSSSKKALLVMGARQVGKTYLINKFLNQKKKSYVRLNLLENKLALDAFNTSFNADELLLKLTAISKSEIIENETIFFIDEIQEAKDAITPIKFLVENGKYRYILSGSLLGVEIKNIRSIPTGYLSSFTLYPLDFEEFAMANGVNQKTFEYLKKCYDEKIKIDETIHLQMMKLFNLYLVIGGFPEAVGTFLAENNLQKVSKVHSDIDFAYQRDISKYDEKNGLLIKDVYKLIPSQLNNSNKRFILKNLNEKARFYIYENTFVWLINSGIGLFTYNVDNPVYPLLASKERTLFKLFLCDVGLLSFKFFKDDIIKVLNGDVAINYGALYENVVAQELAAKDIDLYFYNSKKNGEVDFIIEHKNEIIPIEVKSGKDYKRHLALNNLLKNDGYMISKAIVLCNSNIEESNDRLYLPIYLLIFLNKANSEIKNFKYEIDISALK